MNAIKALIWLLSANLVHTTYTQDEWMTILIHGSIGVGANLNGRTLSLIKKDCIEGTPYEQSVLQIRQHPYVSTLHPLGDFGLHPIPQESPSINGGVIFSELYTSMAKAFGISEKNTFYTFGWSGLISEKERIRTARRFYEELRTCIEEKKKAHEQLKVRLIAYSHGGTMISNFAQLRAQEFCHDTFCIDETILVGVPLNKQLSQAFSCKPFQQIFNLYSRADKVQRIDIFTSPYILSERTFRNQFPCLTQIEFRYTAPLRQLPQQVLPSGMRGTVNQSPGHVEWWSFGWANAMYRKNLDMYPLSGAVFIPFLIHAAQKFPRSHFQVDIRPEQEQALLMSYCDKETTCIPFMTQGAYQAFLNKAFSLHPYFSDQRDTFICLESSLEREAYQYAS